MARTKDRPLTDAQVDVLARIAWAEDLAPVRFHPDRWQAVDYVLRRRNTMALIRLEEMGLIETDAALDRAPPYMVGASECRWPSTRGTGARTTEAGRAMLRSMGD